MYYERLNEEGKRLANLLAQREGLKGKVTTEYTPAGDKCAFFQLAKPARGADCEEACRRLKQAGFDPDLLFMGCPPAVYGGFIGEAFSKKATELKKEAA